MAKERVATLNKWGVTKDRYYELKYICRQYNHYKRTVKLMEEEIAGGFNDLTLSDMPRGTVTSDQTAERAIRLAKATRARERLTAIQRAAMEAEQGIYKQILRNVTQGTPYEHMKVPCGRRYFFDARRRFFWILDRNLTNLGI